VNLLDRIQHPQTGFLTFAFLAQLVALPFTGGVLYWVAQNSGPRHGTVIVHVIERDVVVKVGEATFHVDEYDQDPLVVDLRAGKHRLTMRQGETLLHDETFHLAGGEERVLTAWRSIEKPIDSAKEPQ
jgi:hypothetical protein